MGWEMIVLLIAGGFLYKLKSIHIDFRDKDDDDDQNNEPKDDSKKPKKIRSRRQRKQLKK